MQEIKFSYLFHVSQIEDLISALDSFIRHSASKIGEHVSRSINLTLYLLYSNWKIVKDHFFLSSDLVLVTSAGFQPEYLPILLLNLGLYSSAARGQVSTFELSKWLRSMILAYVIYVCVYVSVFLCKQLSFTRCKNIVIYTTFPISFPIIGIYINIYGTCRYIAHFVQFSIDQILIFFTRVS